MNEIYKIPHREKNTTIFWKHFYNKKQHQCYLCSKIINTMQMDHVIPQCIGGEHNISNIKPTCKECHNDKSVKDRMFLQKLKKQGIIKKVRWKPHAYESTKSLEELEKLYSRVGISISAL